MKKIVLITLSLVAIAGSVMAYNHFSKHDCCCGSACTNPHCVCTDNSCDSTCCDAPCCVEQKACCKKP